MANNVQKQSQELANQLWAIANELRGNMDASKFRTIYLRRKSDTSMPLKRMVATSTSCA